MIFTRSVKRHRIHELEKKKKHTIQIIQNSTEEGNGRHIA